MPNRPRPTWLLLVLLGIFSSSARANEKAAAPIGVAILPRTADFPDDAERVLYEHVKERKDIQDIHAASSPEDMLRIIESYRAKGQPIGRLVLGGHGPKVKWFSSADTNMPWLQLGRSGMGADQVDKASVFAQLEGVRKEIAKVREEMKRLDRSQPRYRELDRRLSSLLGREKTITKRLVVMTGAMEGFAPGAKVFLLNCYALRGKPGRKFVHAIGDLFLGRNGGSIFATSGKVELGNEVTRGLRDRLQRFLDVDRRPINEGDFEKIEIKPWHPRQPGSWAWPVGPYHPWRGKTNYQLMAVEGIRPVRYFQSTGSNTYFYTGPSGELLCLAGMNLQYVDWAAFVALHVKCREDHAYPAGTKFEAYRRSWPLSRVEFWADRKTPETVAYNAVYFR
ncbi:MAG: hypothetical protein ACYTEZ_18465 [Planctomycetota bacterium]|jgi:hypothetical protein